MTQTLYVTVARTDHFGDLVIECQVSIIDDIKHIDSF